MEKLRSSKGFLLTSRLAVLLSLLFLFACSSKGPVYFSERVDEEIQLDSSDRVLILAFDESLSGRGVLEAAVAERFKSRGIKTQLSSALKKSLRDEVSTPAAVEDLLSTLKTEGLSLIHI